jgi:hypothetical protein
LSNQAVFPENFLFATAHEIVLLGCTLKHEGAKMPAPETPAPSTLASYTLPQWLARHQLSRGHWYRLKKAGNAPDTYGTGKAQRISPAADARWLKQQERKAPDVDAARRRSEHGRKAQQARMAKQQSA